MQTLTMTYGEIEERLFHVENNWQKIDLAKFWMRVFFYGVSLFLYLCVLCISAPLHHARGVLSGRQFLRLELVSLARLALWWLGFLFSVSSVGSGTRFWFAVLSDRAGEPFLSAASGWGSGWCGTLSPVRESGSGCRFDGPVVVAHWPP